MSTNGRCRLDPSHVMRVTLVGGLLRASPHCRQRFLSSMSLPMNPDLARERQGASFNVRELTHWLDGGADRTAHKEKIRAIVIADPVFRRTDSAYNDRETAYTRALERVHRVQEIVREKNLNEDDQRLLKQFVGETMPTFLHDQVFIPNLLGQMSPEQQAKWVDKAKNYAIIGCYAQTELGHGSNVRGLETTATFIPETDQFDIHTPSLRATKFWPGCMGRTANYAVVYARLILPDASTGTKDYGVHPFLVQLRSLKDHSFVKGVTTGDIGAKFGTSGNDNGWLKMDHVRIPRDQMLMRFSKVDRHGAYSTPPHAKLAYGTMVVVRAGLVAGASLALGTAATIGIRYAAVRRQGFVSGNSGPETQILDYRMQQYRLFPHLASVFALHCTGRWMLSMYDALSRAMAEGDLSLLAEVHATSSGLKSLTTDIASAGIEDIRRACGGHGYLVASGLVSLYGDYVQGVTVEGDNYLLHQQTVRYLLKAYERGRKSQGKSQGQTVPKPNSFSTVDYLGEVDRVLAERCGARDEEAFLNANVLVAAYAHRAALLVHETAEHLAESLSVRGRSPSEAWNDALVCVSAASRAHCMYAIVRTFRDTVRDARANGTLSGAHLDVLDRLVSLFALSGIERDLGDFTRDGYIDAQQVRALKRATLRTLEAVRPDAVALVDALNLSDFELNSALGVHSGNVYEAVMEWAGRSPLNKEPVHKATYEKYIKPMIHQTGPFAAKL